MLHRDIYETLSKKAPAEHFHSLGHLDAGNTYIRSGKIKKNCFQIQNA